MRSHPAIALEWGGRTSDNEEKMKAIVCALGLFTISAFAQTPEKAREDDLAKASQIAKQVCAACHGPDGNSSIPANPILAGQHAHYTTKQLADFKSEARKSAIMQPMVANLSPEDMRALGVFFSEQAIKPSAVRDKSLVELGQKIYRGGIIDTGVPACAGCHSPTGAGIPIQYPRLSGQFADYTFSQLKAFRSGERANDSQNMMQTIASKMNEQQMRAVAEYIAGLRFQMEAIPEAKQSAK